MLIPNRESNNNDPVEQSYGEAPRPTPQVGRKKGKFDFRGRDRENIVMQDEEESGYLRQGESRDFNVEDSTNLMKKPDMKIKRLTPRR